MKTPVRTALAISASLFLLSIASMLIQSVRAQTPTSTTTIDARRSFYLTKASFKGGGALTACTTGYHMASIWEIKETTFLKYHNRLGRNSGDSNLGGGPPGLGLDEKAIGWVRLGTKGVNNCRNWTSSNQDQKGSWAALTLSGDNQPVWYINSNISCNGAPLSVGVWCVQD